MPVAVEVVADDTPAGDEGEADVVESPEPMLLERGIKRRGKDRKRAELFEPFTQVEAADIEGEFQPQHVEEAVDVIDSMAGRLGNEIDTAAGEPGQRPRTAFVARPVRAIRRLPA
ncbi:hypothetical protein [Rhizobium leguminosarum]|uniref:hypothetical protein n=1 Tax=Rhizobium leguminosarum TaxID=384 RepID=UPI0039657832